MRKLTDLSQLNDDEYRAYKRAYNAKYQRALRKKQADPTARKTPKAVKAKISAAVTAWWKRKRETDGLEGVQG